MSANPWRYFRTGGDNAIRRVRQGDRGSVFYRSGGRIESESLSFYLTNSDYKEITESEAVDIIGSCPWETQKQVRYFACRGEPRYPAITRFVGESGMIYGSDGSSREANQNLRWHEENAPEVNEAEAIKIVGGKPWEPEMQKQVRYFYDPKFPGVITRFDGEDGMCYGDDVSSCKPLDNLAWHKENEIEITEEQAIKILGGKRPWEPEPQSPATAVQPAPTPTSGRPVWEMVIEDMHARNRFGAEKHGTPLQVDNGRDKLVDAYQEQLDKCVYMRAWIEQRNAAVALLRESKQFCGTKTAEMIDQAIAMLMGGGEC